MAGRRHSRRLSVGPAEGVVAGMNGDGYQAFIGWCVAHGVEACGREQYETWTTPRLQRYMRQQFARRDAPNPTAVTLF